VHQGKPSTKSSHIAPSNLTVGHSLKSYTTVGLLGSCTTSFDSEGEIISMAPYAHVTRETIEGVLDKFRGNIYQMPPMSVIAFL
jgi:tRNA U55 pseudouridine synthase TruB